MPIQEQYPGSRFPVVRLYRNKTLEVPGDSEWHDLKDLDSEVDSLMSAGVIKTGVFGVSMITVALTADETVLARVNQGALDKLDNPLRVEFEAFDLGTELSSASGDSYEVPCTGEAANFQFKNESGNTATVSILILGFSTR